MLSQRLEVLSHQRPLQSHCLLRNQRDPPQPGPQLPPRPLQLSPQASWQRARTAPGQTATKNAARLCHGAGLHQRQTPALSKPSQGTQRAAAASLDVSSPHATFAVAAAGAADAVLQAAPEGETAVVAASAACAAAPAAAAESWCLLHCCPVVDHPVMQGCCAAACLMTLPALAWRC